MIIDEKGRLFGLINLLDLVLLIGAVILLYLGVSVWLIYRQPLLVMKDISPRQLEAGETPTATLSLVNEKRLTSARVRLIPKDSQGQAIELNGTTNKRVRDIVLFDVPAGLQPGQYTLELEAETEDLLYRRKQYTTRQNEQVLTVKAKPATPAPPAPPAPPKVWDRGKYFWPMELEMFFPPDQWAAAGLSPGMDLADPAGGFNARVLSVRESRSRDTLNLADKSLWQESIPYRGGRVAWMLVQVDFVDLPSFCQQVLRPGGQLGFRRGERTFNGYLLGMVAVEPELPDNLVRWEVEVVMLSLDDTQRQVLAPNVMQIDPASGLVMAEIVQVYQGQGIPWRKVVQPREPNKMAPGSNPVNTVARMKLLCELKDGWLFYGGILLEADVPLSFVLGGQKMVGTVQNIRQQLIPLEFNVIFPMIPKRLAEQLEKGMQVADPQKGKPLGTIQGIIEMDSIDFPQAYKAKDRVDLGGEYLRVLVRMEISCSLDDKGLSAEGQLIDYGQPIKVVLFTDQLEGTITSRNSLPPRLEFSWQEVKVVFRNVPPEVAALIAEGVAEAAENEPSTKVIGRIISIEPAPYLEITNRGTLDVSPHPENRDINCLLRIKAHRQGEKLFYAGNQLYLGGALVFITDRWRAVCYLVDL
ncbi:MAG: hypothetical protein JXQ83_03980 [Candidatus Glassbacteria bacterium]|nr:hypothetical protein [Candidatus Glassbacteria bacterium]